MKKTMPFKKEIMFKNTIDEIVSISMDNHLEINELELKGNFIISGEYEYAEKKESFNFDIPYLGYLDEKYDTKNAKLDIDDFYYEVSEPNKLSIFIDIGIDNLFEQLLIEPEIIQEDIKELEPIIEDVIEDVIEESREEEPKMIFNSFNDIDESYMTYKVYIAREGDTVETILEKYQISYDQLIKYNVINELVIGDKLIIPHEKN
jgi:LysM domain.